MYIQTLFQFCKNIFFAKNQAILAEAGELIPKTMPFRHIYCGNLVTNNYTKLYHGIKNDFIGRPMLCNRAFARTAL
jgi:hypothetical protein